MTTYRHEKLVRANWLDITVDPAAAYGVPGTIKIRVRYQHTTRKGVVVTRELYCEAMEASEIVRAKMAARRVIDTHVLNLQATQRGLA